MGVGDKVHVIAGRVPGDYHCDCSYCTSKVIGELRAPDGSYYSRLERRKYYHPSESGTNEDGTKAHIAKTPLHIARWAIQAYTERGDWVLDPTIGAGTTAVEAITQGRSASGMEIEYGDVLKANVGFAMAGRMDVRAEIGIGDARNLRAFLMKGDREFKLVVNNPPYSGDISMPSPKGKLRGKEHRHLETRFDYDKDLPNLAFLKEGEVYWSTMRTIYGHCIDRLAPGGRFVIGVKDMMRDHAPFFLHRDFAELLTSMGLEHEGTAFLKHYPLTLFLNSYEKMHGAKPPFYQTITVFRKPEAPARGKAKAKVKTKTRQRTR
jgi:DNA modification methylase